MGETYCGKSCEECTYKERVGCGGCKEDFGRIGSGACELARCCRDKGHETCDTCSYAVNCVTRQGRGNVPIYRLKDQEEKDQQEKVNRQKAPLLCKWLSILFWLVVPSTIAGIMTTEIVVGWFPALSLPGEILNILCTVIYGVVLLKLSRENAHYRTSGICCLIAAAAGIVVTLATGGDTAAFPLVLTLPALVLSLVGEYHEYAGHSEVISYYDHQMAGNWSDLWKWYIGVYIALMGGIVFMMIVPILGALVTIVAAIALTVVAILKLIYLYRSAKIYREYLKNIP